MSEFIQLHLLVSYPPSNLNRDDLGRPKTAVMGGSQRLRVSSQSLKRAWRQSEIFKEALGGHLGIRTKEIGPNIEKALVLGKSLSSVLYGTSEESRPAVAEKDAKETATAIASRFGKCEKDLSKHKQMVHFSGDEIEAIDSLLGRIAEKGEEPSDDDLDLLRRKHATVDIAMFGRMLADAPAYNMEGAVQVSHGITVHDVVVEDDYFTAVDDLNTGELNMGSGHIGEFEFAAGLFYTYICVNRDLLIENLSGDNELADRAIQSLIEAAAKIGPTGKQNSFASRAYASYILAEKGNQQPRSLGVAFLKPVKGQDMLVSAIEALEETRERMDQAYGKCADDVMVMNAVNGDGKLNDILAFAAK